MLFPAVDQKKINSLHEKSIPIIDMFFFGVVSMVIILGFIMVVSASISVAAKSGDQFYYAKRQAIFIVIGIAAAVTVFKIPLKFWHKSGFLFLMLAVCLIIAVLIPGIGKEVNGSKRWIPLGIFNLQASEPVKLCMIIYLSGYLLRRLNAVRESIKGFLLPMAILTLVVFLLLLEPDFGSAVVISGTFLALLFLAGAKLWQYVMIFFSMGGAMALLAVTSPYRLARLTGFLDPWADQFNSGFQLTQSLIAIGSGGIFGVGIGNSVQKLFYLPEAHTDFIFAVFAEELGLVGVIILITAFAFIVMRAMKIGVESERSGNFFGAYLAYGLGLWIGVQAFINIGVNMGVLPTKGLTLPFMSYGGSSLIVMFVVFALILRVDYENRLKQLAGNCKKCKADKSKAGRKKSGKGGVNGNAF
ncbi:MAG: putative lipid II flippase FtsW [Gammaproteobacteria bacterium]|nr:MAG: putative lipid II flippase FtsW [Gammaproteobacteria bacterium]